MGNILIKPYAYGSGVAGTWTANNAVLSAKDGGLVAYWKAEDVTEERNARTLTNTGGVTFTAGKRDNAFTFDGTNKKLTTADSADWAWGTDPFSVFMWVTFVDISTYRCLFSFVDSGLDQTFLRYYNNELIFQCNNTGGGNINVTESWTPATDGTWYLVGLTRGWEGNANDWALTIDGSILGTPTVNAGSITDRGADLTIGQKDGGQFMNGQIDEFGIWKSVAISSTEASALYNGGTGAFLI